MYVSLDDVNHHLPTDKISVTESELVNWDRTAGRIVRGYLATYFTPTVIAGWAAPATTPELIRDITGRLIAAAYYAERFSEDDPDYPTYAQNLYNNAINQLLNIQQGRMILIDSTGTALVAETHSLSTDDFWPNDSTGRLFSMGMNF